MVKSDVALMSGSSNKKLCLAQWPYFYMSLQAIPKHIELFFTGNEELHITGLRDDGLDNISIVEPPSIRRLWYCRDLLVLMSECRKASVWDLTPLVWKPVRKRDGNVGWFRGEKCFCYQINAVSETQKRVYLDSREVALLTVILNKSVDFSTRRSFRPCWSRRRLKQKPFCWNFHFYLSASWI